MRQFQYLPPNDARDELKKYLDNIFVLVTLKGKDLKVSVLKNKIKKTLGYGENTGIEIFYKTTRLMSTEKLSGYNLNNDDISYNIDLFIKLPERPCALEFSEFKDKLQSVDTSTGSLHVVMGKNWDPFLHNFKEQRE